eukprot:scaffold42784_cov214-Amphora_coffeaeformis.AAC.12
MRINGKKRDTCNAICVEVASRIVGTTVLVVQNATSPVLHASVRKRCKILVAKRGQPLHPDRDGVPIITRLSSLPECSYGDSPIA